MMFDHPKWPADLRARQEKWCRENCQDEAKAGETDQQFLYKTRKKTYGPFKKDMWDLPAAVKGPLFDDLERKFEFLMKQLQVPGTRAVVERFVQPTAFLPPMPQGAGAKGQLEEVEGE
jgi:hypothetical protein